MMKKLHQMHSHQKELKILLETVLMHLMTLRLREENMRLFLLFSSCIIKVEGVAFKLPSLKATKAAPQFHTSEFKSRFASPWFSTVKLLCILATFFLSETLKVSYNRILCNRFLIHTSQIKFNSWTEMTKEKYSLFFVFRLARKVLEMRARTTMYFLNQDHSGESLCWTFGPITIRMVKSIYDASHTSLKFSRKSENFN